MNRSSRLVQMLIAVVLVIAACGGGDDASDDTTTTTATTEAAPAAQSETTEDTTTTTTEPDCIADPIATGSRPEVGTIEHRYTTNIERDCQPVFNGDPIFSQGVLATDTAGSFDFSLATGVDSCNVLTSSEVEVYPVSDVALRVKKGQLGCWFAEGFTDKIETAGGVLLTNQMQTFAIISGDPDGPVLGVTEGFMIIEPHGRNCRSVIGPHQMVELEAGLPLRIEPILLPSIPSTWKLSAERLEADAAPPAVGMEIMPGLADLIDAKDVTVSVEGELIGAEAAPETALPVLERITGLDLQVALPGQIEIVDVLPITELPLLELQVIEIDPNLFRQPQFELEPVFTVDEFTRALDQTQPITPASFDLLIDPEGNRWEIVYDSTDSALGIELEDIRDNVLQTGAFGQFYREAFEAEPNYDWLLPGLLDGAPSCQE